MFKVGDKVISKHFGTGEVVEIKGHKFRGTLPIIVEFADGRRDEFSKDGWYYSEEAEQGVDIRLMNKLEQVLK